MATVRIIRFSKATLLRRIAPALFLEFARSFDGFFTRCGVALPAVADPDAIPYAGIARVTSAVRPSRFRTWRW